MSAIASDHLPAGVGPARVAFGLGLVSAMLSAYWATGGTWLVDTIGGSLEGAARTHSPVLLALLLLAVGLKIGAATTGLLATGLAYDSRWRRPSRIAAWVGAAILTIYGGVYSAVGWLVQAGVIVGSGPSNPTALRWHAYLWDPWFLIRGVRPM